MKKVKSEKRKSKDSILPLKSRNKSKPKRKARTVKGTTLTMHFRVVMKDASWLCDDEYLKTVYGGDWQMLISDLYKEEGFFWNEELELVDVTTSASK